MTQADLADSLAVSRQSINVIEKGKFDMSLPLVFKMSKLFELVIEKIFDNSEKERFYINAFCCYTSLFLDLCIEFFYFFFEKNVQFFNPTFYLINPFIDK